MSNYYQQILKIVNSESVLDDMFYETNLNLVPYVEQMVAERQDAYQERLKPVGFKSLHVWWCTNCNKHTEKEVVSIDFIKFWACCECKRTDTHPKEFTDGTANYLFYINSPESQEPVVRDVPPHEMPQHILYGEIYPEVQRPKHVPVNNLPPINLSEFPGTISLDNPESIDKAEELAAMVAKELPQKETSEADKHN